MSRRARAVAVGYPNHVTQRGNNREAIFIDDEDRRAYLQSLKHYAQEQDLIIWAYCLMPNHVHLLVVPNKVESLAFGIGRTNLRYTRYFNRKYFRSGRIWQNRFYSSIVDTDQYLWAVARYIESNPVRAGLCRTAEEFAWSSARHHLLGRQDPLLQANSWLEENKKSDYQKFLQENNERIEAIIGKATGNGRPICGLPTLRKLENLLNRSF